MAWDLGTNSKIGTVLHQQLHKRQPGIVSLSRCMEDRRLPAYSGLIHHRCCIDVSAAIQKEPGSMNGLELGGYMQQRPTSQGKHTSCRCAEIKIGKSLVEQIWICIQQFGQFCHASANDR